MLQTPVAADASLEVLNPTSDEYGQGRAPLAPRLKSLSGAVVGLLWNGKPRGDIALKAVGKLIQQQVPDADVRFYPGTIRFTKELLAQAAEECDAVITCAADCGACSSYLIHDSIHLEKLGIPSVTIASRGFEKDCQATGAAFGMPDIRYVVVPRVYNALTDVQAEEQTLPVVDEIVRLLTEEIAETESALDPTEAPLLNFTGEDTLEALSSFNSFYLSKEWGDGYPLLAPTTKRVEKLLEGLQASRDDLVCILPPGMGHATVEKVAINAAMAGCSADETLVVMAALRAISKCPPPLDKSVLMSTGAFAPLVLVNGPIIERLRVNGGRCCLGPGKQNEVNIRIGRAVTLCLKNIGRWVPGVMDLDSIGTPRKFNLCMAENQADSPWEPYHVTQGFRPDDDTVTIFHTTGDWDIPISGFVDGYQLLKAFGAKMPWADQVSYMVAALGHLTGKEDGRLLLINPEQAKAISDYGFSKTQAEKILHQHIRPRVSDLIEPLRGRMRDGLIKPEYHWMFELSPDEARRTSAPAYMDAESIKIVVAGSHTPKPLLFGTLTPPITEPVTASADGRRA
ncbi:MAG TPA: hypothetical protein VD906_08780 [Caulobacteraceae bacterium]|nr:hypothetical protein [Caulobacteraceae bacterium]